MGTEENTSQEIEKKLTPKQELFCRIYVNNGHNGNQAAIEAGYSKQRARITAAELVTKRNISNFIKELEKPVIEQLELTENWVLTKLKNFSDVTITDFFDVDNLGNIKLKDFSTVPANKLEAIESIKETKYGIQIVLVDKRAAVVDIGKHIGMFKDQLEANNNHNHVHKVYVIPSFDFDNYVAKPATLDN